MIVVSGFLVAVALVLLVVGLTVSLAFIYASIGVSVLAFLVLGLAARQRRTAPPTPPAGAPHASAPDTADPVARPGPAAPGEAADWAARPEPVRWQAGAPDLPGWRAGPEPEPPVEDDDDLLEDEDLLGGERYGGTVLVVPGRPRYHVAGCRYLLGKESADLDVLDAREEGFRPCGLCRPDVALAEELSEVDLLAELREQRRDVVHLEPGGMTVEDELDLPRDDGPTAQPSTPARPAQVATRRKAAAPARSEEAVASAVATAPPPAEDVVLVPERGRYHRPGCRYARDVPSARPANAEVARAAGHQPCGICKP